MWQQFRDGEISLDSFGEWLLEIGHSPEYVRDILSHEIKYPIPIGYFGNEDR